MENNETLKGSMDINQLVFLKSCLPEWSNVGLSDISIEHLKGGLSNFLLKISLVDCQSLHPKAVVLRKFNSDWSINCKNERIIFDEFSKLGWGPNCFGLNSEYRVEEYVESRCLEFGEISDPMVYRKLAYRIAQFHSLIIESIDKTTFIERMLVRKEMWEWLNKKCNSEIFSTDELKFIEQVESLSEETEIGFLKSLVPTKNLVLSHNDIHTNNVLITKNEGLILIDFEEASYNFRGFDIANLFCEGMCILSHAKSPAYQFDERLYPSDEKIKDFLRYYLVFSKMKSHPPEEVRKTLENEELLKEKEMKLFESGQMEEMMEELIEEIEVGSLLSCYSWAIWFVILCKKGDTRFDFLRISMDRFKSYVKFKERFVKKSANKI